MLQTNESSLGSIVTDHFIEQFKLQWRSGAIIPDIVLTNQGILAKKTLIEMIDSLTLTGSIENKNLYNFIKTNYNLPISVLIKNNDDPKELGQINTIFNYSLPLDLKKIKSTSQLSESGVYIFKHSSGKFAIGSAMNFQRRLLDHLNSFYGHRVMQKLHLFTAKNGGLNEITWSPLIITPNFYRLFISMNPDHVLTKQELQILVAITQFMPRVLEQSYISHYEPELTGNKNGSYNVIFSYTKWEPGLIKDSNKNELGVNSLNKSNAYKAIDENKIIVASSQSLNGLASILGLSVAGIKYHLVR